MKFIRLTIAQYRIILHKPLLEIRNSEEELHHGIHVTRVAKVDHTSIPSPMQWF